MKLSNKLLFILPLFSVVTSCDDAEPGAPEVIPPEPPVTFFWEEQSHLAMMGWKGSVSGVKEKTYLLSSAELNEYEEEVSSLEWRFDTNGNLTYYNPTGIEPETNNTRGVWQTMACYSYEYDNAGRLVKAIVDDFSGEPVIYTLVYDEHDVYVPLIFPLGSYDFFLVKGLKTILSEDGTVAYSFDGHKASYTAESWSGVSTTVFEYDANSVYPMRKKVSVLRDDITVSTEVTSYIYNKDGSLSSIDRVVKEGESEVEHTVIRYLDSTLLPASRLTDAGGQMDWFYKYNNDNWWLEVVYKEDLGEGVEAKEMSDYTKIDTAGNWVEALQQQNNMVDWSHFDGPVKVTRSITYY